MTCTRINQRFEIYLQCNVCVCACLSERYERENRLCGAVDFEEEEEEDYVQRSKDELTYDDVSNLIYFLFHLSNNIASISITLFYIHYSYSISLPLSLSVSLSLSLSFRN